MADEKNYDSVWVGDSVLAKPRLEPLTLLAAVAARTRKVKIGTACLSSFPLRHPVLVAQSWATLDQISSGRTILGVCIGGGGRTLSGEAKKEFENLGVPYEHRVKRFEEGIEIVKKLWTENTISYEGTYFQLKDVSLEPKPAQKPSPPIWIASNPIMHNSGSKLIDRANQRVARLADGWMTLLVTPEQFADNWKNIKALAEGMGKESFRMESSLYFNVNQNTNRERAYNESKEYLEKYYLATWTEQMIDSWTALSTSDCVKKIEEYVNVGLDNILIRFTSIDEEVQLEKFTNEVVPSF